MYKKLYIIYYVIHNFRQEGHGEPATKIFFKREKEQGELCTAKSMYTKKKERKLKYAEKSRYKILTIPRECTKI